MCDSQTMKHKKRGLCNSKTGLVLSLTPISARLKRLFPKMLLRKDATVYVTAIVEAVLTDLVLEASKRRTRREKDVMVKHLYGYIKSHELYSKMFRGCTFNFNEITNKNSISNDI